jgi:2-polyprenyl-3-methyl-5-hydroxy-6-metoxy-1,4-benzoquinol methylase
MERAQCNLCGSTRFASLHEIPDLWLERFQIKGNYGFCQDCGLLYQYPQPEPDEDLYPENYAVYTGGQDFFYKWGLKKRSQWVTKYKQHGRLLDIGTGRGDFIAFMRDQRGWEVTGLEPNVTIADRTRRKFNLDVIADTLDKTSFPDRTFDVITMWDVLEHLANPKAALIETRRILRPDGLLILRLPNVDSMDAKLFGKYWAGFDSPRHFYVFSRLTLEKMLRVSGFSIREIGSNIGQYPNFIKSIQFWLTGKKVSPAARKVILTFLRFPPVRILAMPLFAMKDIGSNGSEIVVIATPDFE